MYTQSSTFMTKAWNSPYVICLLLTLYAFLVCSVYTPYWQTNDDVIMMMIAHGLGSSSESDPRLIFSSVIWGYIVQSFHFNTFIAGYTLAAYSLIAASFIAITFCLSKFLKERTIIALPVLAITLSTAILMPQFTQTASCATVASIFLAYCYVTFRKTHYVLLAFLFGVLGFLVRQDAFLMICLLSMPFFPWRFMLRQPRLLVIAMLFFAILAGCVAIDRASYSDEKWQEFAMWENVRGKFSSYRVSDEMLANPEIYREFGFSENDIKLMQDFFFADARFVNPTALQNMMDMTTRYESPTKVEDGLFGMSFFWEEGLIKYFSLITLLLLILFPSKRVCASAILTMLVFWWISYDGHPPTFRVHASALILVSLSALLLSGGKLDNLKGVLATFFRRQESLQRAVMGILCVVLIVMGTAAGKYFQKLTKQTAQNDAIFYDFQPINQLVLENTTHKSVVHGSAYPFESVYRPFDMFSSYPNTKFSWIASLTAAPSMYKLGSTSQDWLFEALQNETITLIVSESALLLISTWLQERTGQHLCVSDKKDFRIKSKEMYRIYRVKASPSSTTCNSEEQTL